MWSMASFSVKDLTCPVCHDIFKHPVILSCSHSLCKACLQEWWRNKPQECPICRDSSYRPTCNRALKNLCESIVRETVQRVWENHCSLHSEEFKLFCLDHQLPVCLICRDSKRHIDHRFRPIGEAARDHREELQKSVKIMKVKLKVFNQVKELYDQITAQASHTEMQKEFMRRHRFLREQEEARITALMDEEEEQKSRIIKEKSVGLSKVMEALSGRIRAIEEELKADDFSILQNYTDTVELVQRPLPDDPELVPGAKIDVVKDPGRMILTDKTKETASYGPSVLQYCPPERHPV